MRKALALMTLLVPLLSGCPADPSQETPDASADPLPAADGGEPGPDAGGPGPADAASLPPDAATAGPDAGPPVGWCNLQWPLSAAPVQGEPVTVYGRVWVSGVTLQIGANADLEGELGYGPFGSNGATASSAWQWVAGVYNVNADGLSPGDHANHEYRASIAPAAANYSYAYRFRYARGPWKYCDLDGSDNGFSPLQQGTLTVRPPPVDAGAVDAGQPTGSDAGAADAASPDSGLDAGGGADAGPPCVDACALGTKRCAGAQIQTCLLSANGCSDWGTAVDCNANEVCSGSVIPACTCSSQAQPCAVGCCRWTVETVDSSAGAGKYPALALDRSGIPYVSYVDSTGNAVRLASKPSSWTIEGVSALGKPASNTALGLSGSTPQVAYWSRTSSTTWTLTYSERTSSGWSAEAVDTATTNSDLSLVVMAGWPTELAYVGDGKSSWAVRNSWGWSHEPVGSLPVGEKHYPRTALAVDGNRTAWVANVRGYFGNTLDNPDVRVWVRNASVWYDLGGPITPYSPVNGVALAVDRSSNLHVVSTSGDDVSPGELNYAFRGAWSSAWSGGPIRAGTCYSVALALDSSGQPHLATTCKAGSATPLLHASRKADGTWSLSAPLAADADSASLALDSRGLPWIAFHDKTSDTLKLVTLAP